MHSERGEATVALSIIGAVAAGAPVAVGAALSGSEAISSFYFVTAIIVGVTSIGAGVGRLYSKWKKQIEASLKRDELLKDICDRIERIETRQIDIYERLHLVEHVDHQPSSQDAKK